MKMIEKTPFLPEECREIGALLKDLTAHYDQVEREDFLCELPVYAGELPRRIRKILSDFKLHEPSGGLCILSGFPMQDEELGKTPEHWKLRRTPSPALREEMLLALLGALLGEPIGWSTQQDGRIMHDIVPIRGHEDEQLGSGSEQTLWWHTEDAFHPFRGDYLGMMCLRNRDGVATTYASLEDIVLSPRQLDLLFQPLFTIRPDESHLKKNRSDARRVDGEIESAYGRIEEMNEKPERIPVLFGDPSTPFIRIDPYFMDPVTDHPEAQQALDALVHQIDAKLEDMVLEQGDFCFIDNFKAVHGRRPFKARYDGWDRWLKRINVARDLRKSRGVRRSASDRVIF
jgi:Fe(II)/alpha-ketoglutarate-dependent arginine beta-hydroxylase